MKITYIYHSGFTIETETVLVVIDFYKDPASIVPGLLSSAFKPVYVLSTHFHSDHFNPEIFEWKELRPDIHYILSHDIKKHRRIVSDGITFLKKGDIYSDDLIDIKAFGSTDSGDSFWIRNGQQSVFHAGDLNDWHWNEESSLQEVKEARNAFKAELADIVKDVQAFDVAFFPVDPRMGKDYALGAEEFLDTIKVGVFIPMHFWDDYDAAAAFQLIAEKHGSQFVKWEKPGQIYYL
ncbi:MBL fold metallo-hydrolase [Coprobacter tertius]|uniref:MBL fold metallo-hydrolase n=1 Tax=Coprobacter tertius TaxID=2944915 RepID=A0ABT1MJK1_9BACT|nr:MBL fold metallo-hydrolase [Coprobacter tertius]MCP9611873.1 MBL fold metallo-hydrolase [Coprobacter tertius]